MKAIFQWIYDKLTKALQEHIALLEVQVESLKEEIEKLEDSVIVIDLMDDTDLNASPKSIRINFFVWDEWQEFCDKNDQYSKKQLVSMALKEYMDKHNNK